MKKVFTLLLLYETFSRYVSTLRMLTVSEKQNKLDYRNES